MEGQLRYDRRIRKVGRKGAGRQSGEWRYESI